METSSVLEVGDVVVVPHVRESHLVYIVHSEGGSDQLTYQARNEATEHAIAHARQRRVNAWYGDRPELGFVLLGWFREPPGGRERAATENEPSNSPSLDKHALFVDRTKALDEKVINEHSRRIPADRLAERPTTQRAGAVPAPYRIWSNHPARWTIMTPLTLSAAVAALLIATAGSAQTTPPFAVATCDPQALTFSNVRLPQPVLADGKPLAAGTYQMRITAERPVAAVGQSPTAECWVEFASGGAVAGRELASVVSAQDIGAVAKGPQPKPHAARVDLLKDGEYLRVWMNGAGTHYIVNLPVAR